MMLKESRIVFAKLTLTLSLTAIFCIFTLCPLMAGTISIQFEDLDIAYDGMDIFDADPGGSDPDPVSNTQITVDGVPLPTMPTGVTVDLFIPGVLEIDAGPGSDTVFSGISGILDLDFGGGEFLDLDLDSVAIIYVDATVFQFVFGATVATVSGQLLPDGLVLGDPISVSFETTVVPDSLFDDGDFLIEFAAIGTGTIQGELIVDPNSIPEPASILLACFGMIGMLIGLVSNRQTSLLQGK